MPLGIWSRFQALAFGGAIGAASQEAIAPQLEPAKQRAWSRNQYRLLDAGTLAEAVATGGITLQAAEEEAARLGINPSRVQALVYLALAAPPLSEALDLRRRGRITDNQLRHALAKAGIEQQYWPALLELIDERLSPEIIAESIQRGTMTDPGFLPVGPPSEVGDVPAFPVSALDPLEEAAASGYDRQRLAALTALIGNPIGPDSAARALFRGIIKQPDFDRAIAEGRTRNEWGFVYRETAREILTAVQAVNLRLRGWVDDAAMYALTSRWGMSREDTDRLFLTQGRPLSFHQVFIGLARGGAYGGDVSDVDPAFLKSLQESDIRPEWYALAWAQRYNYPTAFVLRSLTEGGDITREQAEQILRFEGWPPDLAASVSAKWAGSSGVTVTPEIKSARTKLLTTLHKAYVSNGADDASVIASLQAVPYPQTTIDGLLEVWSNERGFLQGQAPNPPTGGQ